MKGIFLFLVLFITGCANKSDQSIVATKQNSEDSVVLKIFVDKDGIIIVEGNRVTLEMLDLKLDSLQKKNGIVYYSRSNIAAEPPQSALIVAELVARHDLPIKFFSDKKFKKQVRF